MEQLPFTDEKYDLDAYKEECDRLSTLEAQNNHSSFGRWFFEDGMIKTWVCIPKLENKPVDELYTFDFEITKYSKKKEQESLVEHLKTEDWISEKSIKDLKRAFKFLGKHGRISSSEDESP